MNDAYLHSLSSEIAALRDRVRTLIGGRHWQTDGEWKESVLRVVLNRHLPQTIEAARGFVITDGDASTQLDVLLYDRTKPVLFRDGDLVFVAPSAVRGIIEVKASIQGKSKFTAFVQKLETQTTLIRESPGARNDLLVGMFAYELFGMNPEQVENDFQGAIKSQGTGVSMLAAGSDTFVFRRPNNSKITENAAEHLKGHIQHHEGRAYGIFLKETVEHLAKG